MVLQAIKYSHHHDHNSLEILDQLKLPHQETYRPISCVEDAWHAIKEMRVRGAPAIAIVAALSLAVELKSGDADKLDKPFGESSAAKTEKTIVEKLNYLVTSRPTAVNLADAAKKLERLVRSAASLPDATAAVVIEAYVTGAERMLVDDVQDNENIGKHGADWILDRNKSGKQPGQVSVLTHCNTGSLATAGYGTALGIVRSLQARNSLKHVFYAETRPYNQGSRLTGFELIHDGIPATLITDSMAATLLHLKRDSENIAAVVVGADRVATNGDTANKVGTYALAILARYHNVRFLVAAPRTTIDLNTKSGKAIVIEERPPQEMTIMKGPRVRWNEDNGYKAGPMTVEKENIEAISIAAEGTQTWNPAFDVTPAELIDGIVTEVGVVEKGEDGRFDLDKVFEVRETGSGESGKRKRMPSPSEGP